MSTRSLIGRQNADGSISAIYCHSDGYLEGVGQNLVQYWTDPAKVDALIQLGSLSSLGREIGEQHDFDSHSDWRTDDANTPRGKGWCLAYGRDRGEDNTEAVTYTSREDFYRQGAEYWAEHLYLFADGQWWHHRPASAWANRDAEPWLSVADALTAEVAEDGEDEE